MRVSEIRVKRIRVNQGLGVFLLVVLASFLGTAQYKKKLRILLKCIFYRRAHFNTAATVSGNHGMCIAMTYFF